LTAPIRVDHPRHARRRRFQTIVNLRGHKRHLHAKHGAPGDGTLEAGSTPPVVEALTTLRPGAGVSPVLTAAYSLCQRVTEPASRPRPKMALRGSAYQPVTPQWFPWIVYPDATQTAPTGENGRTVR